MKISVLLNPDTVEGSIEQVLSSAKMTLVQRKLLAEAASSNHTLSEQERVLIGRIFYGVRHELITLVD